MDLLGLGVWHLLILIPKHQTRALVKISPKPNLGGDSIYTIRNDSP